MTMSTRISLWAWPDDVRWWFHVWREMNDGYVWIGIEDDHTGCTWWEWRVPFTIKS